MSVASVSVPYQITHHPHYSHRILRSIAPSVYTIFSPVCITTTPPPTIRLCRHGLRRTALDDLLFPSSRVAHHTAAASTPANHSVRPSGTTASYRSPTAGHRSTRPAAPNRNGIARSTATTATNATRGGDRCPSQTNATTATAATQ